jgi:putative PIG3 family NAD(P)H quinone oxidoreductase
MRAVIARDKQAVIVDIPQPEPQAGELLVQVKATALNRADLMQVAGSYPPPPGAPETLGLELAGVVVAVGQGVPQFAVGDRVMALVTGGSYADFAVTGADHTLPIPSNLTFDQAGALVEAYLTAYSNMVDIGGLKSGETVLIHAGASGVGLAAIQIAKALGARVVVTASAGKHAICIEHGADQCIDYQTQSFADVLGDNSVDVILEMIGAAYWDDNVRVLKKLGRLVFIGLMGGNKHEVDFGQIMGKRLSIMGSTLRNRTDERKTDLIQRFGAWALPLFESGTLRPTIYAVLPLENVRHAHDMMRNNENAGKIVLTITS